MGKKNNFSMKIAIIALLVAYVASQAPVAKEKYICCEQGDMWVPTWATKCPGKGRRLQAPVEAACPTKLHASSRVLQKVEHPVAPNCATKNASRILQELSVPTSKGKVKISLNPKSTVFVPLRAGCYQKFPRLWCGSGFSTVRPKPYNNMTVNCCPSRRRQQAVQTKKCPVNIEGIQCFLNNTGKACTK